MKVFVHNFCDDIQPTGRSISVKKNAQSDTYDENIAEDIQLLTAGHGGKIRKNLFKQSKKNREHDAGVNSFYTEFSAARKKANDQKYYVQNHGNCGQWQRNKVGQYDSKTGDTADRSVAWNEEKVYCGSDDCNGNGQDYRFQKYFCVIQLCFHNFTMIGSCPSAGMILFLRSSVVNLRLDVLIHGWHPK